MSTLSTVDAQSTHWQLMNVDGTTAVLECCADVWELLKQDLEHPAVLQPMRARISSTLTGRGAVWRSSAASHTGVMSALVMLLLFRLVCCTVRTVGYELVTGRTSSSTLQRQHASGFVVKYSCGV